jgi:hypothetical protein
VVIVLPITKFGMLLIVDVCLELKNMEESTVLWIILFKVLL